MFQSVFFQTATAQGIQPGVGDIPFHDTASHSFGNFLVTAYNRGSIGGEFPRNSNISYGGVGLMVGAIVDGDTLVTGLFGEWQPDIWPAALFRRKSIDRYHPNWSPDAKSELDLVCNFYDKLEAFATRKRFIRIQYFTLIHEFQTVDAIIKDFYIKNGYEYMQLNNGVEIRLDLLISADNQFVPGKGFDGISCECD